MNKAIFITVLSFLIFAGRSNTVQAQKVALFSYPVEIELTNDQGDMPTKDYLRQYGTKGKKRGVEFIYENATPFLASRLSQSGYNLLSPDTLSAVKSNDYGKPSLTLSKAVATGIADQYLKVHIKDITLPVVEGLTQQDPNSQIRKLVKIRCRIQIYDAKKDLLKDAEGVFQSGEKIENPGELGVDLRGWDKMRYDFLDQCAKLIIAITFRGCIKILKLLPIPGCILLCCPHIYVGDCVDPQNLMDFSPNSDGQFAKS
jgi:hypothetical protein